jgi:hypothetical protein
MIWPQNAMLSALILFLIAMPFLYAARKPVHELIRSVCHLVGGPLRLGARWLQSAAEELRGRNKAVLLEHGREETGQHIEREFERVAALVTRDLQGYPTLQRKLLDEITRIEEDYKKSGEVPPSPPEWVAAVEAMAKVKSGGSSEMVQSVLQEIDRSVNRIHDKAIGEYRHAYQGRHKILAGFMPFWRSLDKTMQQVDKKLTGLETSAAAVDAQMQKYEQINKKTDQAEQTLTQSAFTQFFIAFFVMAVAVGGAFINFYLIARPMSEMVGGSAYVGSLRISEVAALVIIFVEAAMGLFLMETLRITHLFPRIANLQEFMRRRMMWIALVLLVTLAGVEAALALMRDMLIASDQALRQSLAATPQAVPSDPVLARIPTAGQMLLGFILPFALAFVAIPLESLIHSGRTVGGALLVWLVRAVAFVLRILGNLVRHLGRVLITLYDVVIVLPLLIERVVKTARANGAEAESRPLGRAAKS